MLEGIGVQALTVHCRTRDMGHGGEADWKWLEALKNTVSIPIIGNGDVVTPQDVVRMFETGCDGVMIGRGAIQNPWIFRETKHYLATGEVLPEPSAGERVELTLNHLKLAAEYKGERRGTIEFRKHYSGYLKGLRGVAKLRAELMQFDQVAPIEDRLRQYAQELDGVYAA